MRSLPWFRFYHEALDDPKVQRLEPALYKAWVNLLCLASRHGGVLPGIDDVAFALRLPLNECIETLTELSIRGLFDGEETLTPHNWHNRQPPSDADSTVAERQRRYRERHQETDANAAAGSDSNALPNALRNPARTEQNRTEQNRVNQAAPAAPVAAAAAPAQAPEPVKPAEATRAAPKPNKLAEVIDAIKDAGGEVSTSTRDGKAVRECSAPADLIAQAYLAAATGEWGDDFTRRNLSLAFVCNRIDGYRAHAAQARASPATGGGNGYESYDVGGGVLKVRQVRV